MPAAKHDKKTKKTVKTTSSVETSANSDSTTLPRMVINAQYIKDLSFENPHAPFTLLPQNKSPHIDLDFNIQSRPISNSKKDEKQDNKTMPDMIEIVFTIKAQAKYEEQTAFIIELAYGGLFTISHLSPEDIEYLIYVEGPRMLFPYSRAILSQTTQDGGYPALMLVPIDFLSIYLQRREEMGKEN